MFLKNVVKIVENICIYELAYAWTILNFYGVYKLTRKLYFITALWKLYLVILSL